MVRTVKLVGLLLVALVVALAAASDDAPTKLQFNTWTTRGSVVIQHNAATVDQRPLTQGQRGALAELASSGGFYLIKARDTSSPRSPLIASVPALVASSLNDTLGFVMNAEQANAVAIKYTPLLRGACSNAKPSSDQVSPVFTTAASVIAPRNGNSASFDNLREQQEREQQAKEKENTEPQGFYAKYGTYLWIFGGIIVYQLFLGGGGGGVGGAARANAAGGAGGGRGGGR